MKVEKNIHSTPAALDTGKSAGKAKPSVQTQENPEKVTSGKSDNLKDGAIVEEEGEKQRGVIRNLLNGHFKGVADVRLRINFYEELAGLQEHARLDQISEGLNSFKSDATSAFDELLAEKSYDQETKESINELRLQFETTLDELQGSDLDSRSLLESVRAESLALLSALEALLTPLPVEKGMISPETEEVIEEDEEIETTTPDSADLLVEDSAVQNIETDLSILFSQFSATLTTSLDLLQKSAETVLVLPELSEPAGNGKAYEKFLAQYQALQAGGEPVTDVPEEEEQS